MTEFTASDFLECCRRELAYRRRVYPRLIAKGTMSPRKAETEIALMEAMVSHFTALAEREPPPRRAQPDLFFLETGI